MNTTDRFRGALVGLAVGEAFGEQLMGAGIPADLPLVLEAPRWSDESHEAACVARALLRAAESIDPERNLVEAYVEELITWRTLMLRDQVEVEGSTIWAAERLASGLSRQKAAHHWARPGVVAVRAVPIGLLFAPNEVLEPTLSVTMTTHLDPTAVESAVSVAWVVSALVRGGTLDPSLVALARERVAELRLMGRMVSVLDEVLGIGELLHARTLPLERIAEGDGGHHAESAVGLAVLAALWQSSPGPSRPFERAVELAARATGNPRTVAALAGALVGAQRGLYSLPMDVVQRFEGLDVLVEAADALYGAAHRLPTGDTPARAAPHARTEAFVGRLDRVATDEEWSEHEAYEDAVRAASQTRPQPEVVSSEPRLVEEGVADATAAFEAWKRRHG